MATLLGIDLGSHSVKVALMEGRLGRLELSEFRERRVVSASGGDASLEERCDALKSLLDEGLDSSVQVAGFPTEKVSVRAIEMPFADPGQIDKTLIFELEGHVPFDLDDFVLDYRLSRGGRGARLSSEGKSLVLCGMAPEDSVEEWVNTLESSGADPRQAVLDGEMLGYLADDDKVQLVVDIGHCRSLLAFCVQGEVLDLRAVEHGGSELTQALMTELGLTAEEAERQKHAANLAQSDDGAGESDPDAARVAAVLNKALQSLIAQMRTSVFSFEGRHGLELEEILLTGGGSHLGGVSRVLGRGLGIPARQAGISDEARDMGQGARFSVAHGLALRAAGIGGRAAFEFRKGRLAHAGNLAFGKSLMRYGAVALVFFALGGMILYGMKRSNIQGDIGTIEDQIISEVVAQFPDLPASALEGDNKAFNTLLDVAGKVGGRVAVLESTVAGEPPTLSLLKELSEALPSPTDARVEVTNLTISETSVVMKAKTTGYEAASTIESAIQSNKRFEEATRGDEKKQRDGLTFSITIPLETSDEEEEEG